MKRLAWAASVLGLVIAAPRSADAQVNEGGGHVQLDRNYPNPFNPETWIPFALDESVFGDGHRPVVSLKIYNVLAQLVAVPILQGSGKRLENLAMEWNGTGRYTAYWNGESLASNREAASGVYVYQLTVDGQRFSKKMTVVK